MSTHHEHDLRNGMLHPSIAMLVESTRSVTHLAARGGRAGARVMLPSSVAQPVSHLLTSMRSMVEQAPHLTDEIDVLMSELKAKRLSIQAVTAELITLDAQLEILERTLSPVQTWSTQFNSIQRSLTHALLHSIDPASASTDGELDGSGRKSG